MPAARAPARAAAAIPTTKEPLSRVTEKPAMAPRIIIPSRPRLSTPDRSTTNSPMATKISGIGAMMIA